MRQTVYPNYSLFTKSVIFILNNDESSVFNLQLDYQLYDFYFR